MVRTNLDPWQFRLSREVQPDAHAVGDFWLQTGEGLPVISIIDGTGHSCGLLLGFLLDLDSRNRPEAQWQTDALFDPANPNAFALHVLNSLGGRFLIILAGRDVTRIYPDSGAQVTCVYDHEKGQAGSTAMALMDEAEYAQRFQQTLYEQLGVDGEGWFPAGLTAHRGLERLLPGHFLDLDTGRFQRFWPAEQPELHADPLQLTDEIITIIQAQIAAITAAGRRPVIALTAGYDSRFILACARPFLEQADVMTVVDDHQHSKDTIVSRQITRRFGLNHIELTQVRATREERDLFILRGGHCNADANSWLHPSTIPIANSHDYIGGVGGGYVSGYLWRDADTADLSVTAAMLCHRFGLAATDKVVAAFQAWLDGLPPLDAFTILDLAYLENRQAPWASAQFCCDPTLVRYAPMLSWPVVRRVLSLPPQWRRDAQMGQEIIAKCWPELGDIPYNTLGPWQDFLFKVKKVMADPRVVIKKWRKLRG